MSICHPPHLLPLQPFPTSVFNVGSLLFFQVLHYTLQPAHCTLNTPHSTLHTAHCTLHTSHWPAHYTLHTVELSPASIFQTWESLAASATFSIRGKYCTALHYIALHLYWIHCTTLFRTALHFITLHFTLLHCTTLYYTALHSAALPTLNCTSLHSTTLHHILLTNDTLYFTI